MNAGQDIRAIGYDYRIAYRPNWDVQRPYITYYRGTASRHFPSLDAAKQYFQRWRAVKWSDPS